MIREKSPLTMLACLLIMAGYAVLQFRYPSFIFFDGCLIISALLTILLKREFYTKLFLIIGILMIGAAAYYSYEHMNNQQATRQHLFSGGIFIIVSLFVLCIKKLYISKLADEQQMNALFEYATEGIILTNHKGEIVLANPAALKLLNYEHEELIRKPIETLIPGRFHAFTARTMNSLSSHLSWILQSAKKQNKKC